MPNKHKYLILFKFLLVAFAATSTLAQAQTWPTKPVRVIIPFPPGASTNDILGRALAQRLSEALGQQFVVDNRPGAGGNLGSELGAKAVPDGYTLLIGTNGPIGICPHIKSGKLKALAITMPKRTQYLPEVPTAAEQGHPQLDVNSWVGLLAPAKTPPAIIEKLHTTITRIMATPEMKTQVVNNGADPTALGPKAFGEFLKSESAKWAQVAKAANLRVE